MTNRDLNKKILCLLLAAFASQGLSGCSMDESSDEEMAQDSDFLGESENGESSDESANAEESSDDASSSEEELTDNEGDAADGSADEFADEGSTDETAAASEDKANVDQELADAGGEEDFEKEFGDGDSVAQSETKAQKDDFADPLQSDATAQTNPDQKPEESAQAMASTEPPPAEPLAPDSTAVDAGVGEPSPDLLASETTDGSNAADNAANTGAKPLRKIEAQPFMKNGKWMNSVYIGRPGDSVEAISQKIYGADHSSEITSNNPWLSDGIKPGEKLYYNSPLRPADNAAMLTYFEDKNLQPQTYMAKEGDNIRSIAQNLLGYPEAWKEVWATNSSIESKDVLSPGTELKYWKDDVGSAPIMGMAMAETVPPISTSPGMPIPNPLAAEQTPVDPLALENQNSLSSAGNSQAGAPPFDPLAEPSIPDPSTQLAQQTPLADSPTEAQVPTPAAPTETQDLSSQNEGSGPSNDPIIFGGLALVIVAALVAIKIKKSKGTPVNMEFTQV